MTTKITLETSEGVYTASTFSDGMVIYDLVNELVRAVLLASGYHPDSVDRAIGEQQ